MKFKFIKLKGRPAKKIRLSSLEMKLLQIYKELKIRGYLIKLEQDDA